LVLLVALIGGAIIWLDWQLRAQPPDSALPPIARNLPRTFSEADKVFQQRVMQSFSGISDPMELEKQVKAEGFAVRYDKKSRTYVALVDQHAFPCALFWIISWTVVDRSVANLNANYYGSCL